MKTKLSLLAARLIVWALFGQKTSAGERTIDTAIAEHKRMLKLMAMDEQYEIIRALINWRFPGRHIHENPKKRKAA